MSAGHCTPFLGTHARTTHPHNIGSGNDIQRAWAGDHEGRKILRQRRQTTHHRTTSDPTKLVHDTVTAQKGMVTDFHVAREQHAIREDDTLTQTYVMRAMRIGHQHALSTDLGHATLLGSPMYRDALPQDTAITNTNPTPPIRGSPILGYIADNSSGVQSTFVSDRYSRKNRYVRTEYRARTDFDTVFDDAEGPDGYRVAHPDVSANKRCRMNHDPAWFSCLVSLVDEHPRAAARCHSRPADVQALPG